MSFSKLDYCQSLLSSPVNYTVTNLADHLDGISHDRINRYLCGETVTPRLLWENVKLSLRHKARIQRNHITCALLVCLAMLEDD